MIQVATHPNGVVVSVRAQPRARQGRIVGEHAGSLKVSVTEPPEQGKANQSIIDLLANHLGLKRSQVQLISGATSRDKRFLLIDQGATEIQARLERFTAKSK